MPTRTANDRLDQRVADVELALAGSGTWVAYNSYLIGVSADVTELESSEFRTLDGTVEVEEDDSLAIESVTLRMVLTDAVDGAYDVLYAALRSTDKRVDVRWSQGGATTGDRQFTTVGGKVVSCPPASFDSTTKGSVVAEAKITCSSVTKGTKA